MSVPMISLIRLIPSTHTYLSNPTWFQRTRRCSMGTIKSSTTDSRSSWKRWLRKESLKSSNFLKKPNAPSSPRSMWLARSSVRQIRTEGRRLKRKGYWGCTSETNLRAKSPKKSLRRKFTGTAPSSLLSIRSQGPLPRTRIWKTWPTTEKEQKRKNNCKSSMWTRKFHCAHSSLKPARPKSIRMWTPPTTSRMENKMEKRNFLKSSRRSWRWSKKGLPRKGDNGSWISSKTALSSRRS